jgi:hypothetical protein
MVGVFCDSFFNEGRILMKRNAMLIRSVHIIPIFLVLVLSMTGCTLGNGTGSSEKF